MSRWRWFFVVCCAATYVSCAAGAQVVAVGRNRPAPRANIGGAVTMMATPSLVTIPLVAKGKSLPSPPITIATSWGGFTVLGTISIYAYFTSPTMALKGMTLGGSIPSSCVSGTTTAGVTGTFNGNGPVNGASLQLFSTLIIIGIGTINRTDTLGLQIDLTSLPNLQPDTYTGVMVLQIQAM